MAWGERSEVKGKEAEITNDIYEIERLTQTVRRQSRVGQGHLLLGPEGRGNGDESPKKWSILSGGYWVGGWLVDVDACGVTGGGIAFGSYYWIH